MLFKQSRTDIFWYSTAAWILRHSLFWNKMFLCFDEIYYLVKRFHIFGCIFTQSKVYRKCSLKYIFWLWCCTQKAQHYSLLMKWIHLEEQYNILRLEHKLFLNFALHNLMFVYCGNEVHCYDNTSSLNEAWLLPP